MKILYHHRIGSTDGGEVIHIRELIAAFRELGHEVVVSSPIDLDNSEVNRPLRSALKFRDKLPGFVSDTLEFLLSVPTLFYLLAKYLRHKPDVVYERANLFSVATVALKRITGCPLLVEVNAPLTMERAQYGRLSLHKLAKWSEEVVWRSADLVLPVTESLAEITARADVPTECIAVIPNGVRADDFETHDNAKQQLGFEEEVVLGFVGYPRDWNRLDNIVRLLAEKEFAKVHFVVVGDGPALTDVRALVSSLGLAEQVTFIGSVPRDRVPYYVSSFDIALQPGVTPYACPLKIVEYMAMRRAILAPDQANVRELLTNGQTALLFKPDDLESLRSTLLRLCGDPVLRARLAAAANEKIRADDYTWSNNAKRITKLAEGLLAN